MRRVLRQVITGLVSILLDAILQSSGGGSGGGRRGGAREGEEAGPREAGRGARAAQASRARAGWARRVHERAPYGTWAEGAGRLVTDWKLRMQTKPALQLGHRSPS